MSWHVFLKTGLTDVMTAMMDTARTSTIKDTTVPPFRTIPDHSGQFRSGQWETRSSVVASGKHHSGIQPWRTVPQWDIAMEDSTTVGNTTRTTTVGNTHQNHHSGTPGPVPWGTCWWVHVPGYPLPRYHYPVPHTMYHHHRAPHRPVRCTHTVATDSFARNTDKRVPCNPLSVHIRQPCTCYG